MASWYRCSVVSVCVCLDTTVSPAKVAEPIDMSGPGEPYVRCAPGSPRGKGSLGFLSNYFDLWDCFCFTVLLTHTEPVSLVYHCSELFIISCTAVLAWYVQWPCARPCLSQVRVLSKRLNTSTWYSFWAWELPLTTSLSNHTVVWNFVLNSGLSHGKSMVLSTQLFNGRACVLRLWWSKCRGWMHLVYYTSIDCNHLTPLLQLVWLVAELTFHVGTLVCWWLGMSVKYLWDKI